MGGKPWTTPEERAFLKVNIKQYESAQGKKKTSLWMTEFIDRFFDKFKDYSTGRNTTPHEKVEKRIRAWFNNRTGIRNREDTTIATTTTTVAKVAKIRTGGKAPRDPLAPILVSAGSTRPKQKLQPVQAYSVLNYRKGKNHKALIDEEWDLKPDSEKYDADGSMRGPRLRYRNKRMDELFEAEPQTVKDEVDAYRNSKAAEESQANSFLAPEENLLDDDEKERKVENRMIQRAIDNSERACECITSAFQRYAKATVLITVLANEPKRGGELAVFQYTAGNRLSDGSDFFTANPEAANRITRDLKVFHRSCVDEDAIRDMRIVYPQANEAIPSVVDVAPPEPTPGAAEPVPREPSPDRDVWGRPMVTEKDFARANRSKGKYKQPRPRSPSPSDEQEVDLDMEGLQQIDDDEDWFDEDDPNSLRRECPESPSLAIVRHLGGEGDAARFLLADGNRVSRYELYRLRNIARNNRLMEDLGIPEAVQALVGSSQTVSSRSQPQSEPARNAGTPRIPPARASKEGDKSYVSPGINDLERPATYTQKDAADGTAALTHYGPDESQGAPTTNSPPTDIGLESTPAVVAPTIRNAEKGDGAREAEAPSFNDEDEDPPSDDELPPFDDTAPPFDKDVPVEDRAMAPSVSGNILNEQLAAPRGSDDKQSPSGGGNDKRGPSGDGDDNQTPSGSGDDEQPSPHCINDEQGLSRSSSADVAASRSEECANEGPRASAIDPSLPDVVQSGSLVENASSSIQNPLTATQPAVIANENASDASKHSSAANADSSTSRNPSALELPGEAPIPDDEPSSSPREKAKRIMKNARLNATGLVSDDNPPSHEHPLGDISSAATNKASAAGVDALDVPISVRDQFVYLRSILQGSRENKLLLDWLTLECEDEGKAVTSKLPVALRPKPIVAWTKRNKTTFDNHPAFEVAVLARDVRAWWTSLMPKWRLPPGSATDGNWPLQRSTPDGEPWTKVRKVGQNGIFLVLLALSWWRSETAPGQPLRREYTSVLEDVAWVLNEITKELVPFSQRARPSASGPSVDAMDVDRSLATITSRGRETRASKRKMGSSGASPIRNAAKRARTK